LSAGLRSNPAGMLKFPGAASAGLLLAALSVCSCARHPPQQQAVPRTPLGIREALRPGHWRGQIGPTIVDFLIGSISPDEVAIQIYGSMPPQANRSMETQHVPTSFYDRPRTCRIDDDGRSFTCNRYSDMHIDNGFLCGNYEAPNETYHPCLPPAS
jgi:hypothetical protein